MSQNEITNDRMNEEKTVSAVGVRWSRRPIVEVVVVELSFGNAQQTLKGGYHLGTHQEHPGGVFDDLGAVFGTSGSRSVCDLGVKTE